MREAFQSASFYAESRKTIEQANKIIAKYQAQGYTLTLRQLYYQFVSLGLVENSQKNYKRIGDLLNKARLAGLVDWDAIEDRTRWLRSIPTYKTPLQFLKRATEGYAEQLWSEQETYCEVWIEKDALIGVIERTCNAWRVPYFPCRGYASQSEMYEAGQRFKRKLTQHQRVVVFHLGDHDPSGIDMSRDNDDRLNMFANSFIEVRRLALNMDQVETYNPPENPTKETDSRHVGYYEQFGDDASSWELDALSPEVINDLVDEAIKEIVDIDLYREKEAAETANRDRIRSHVDNFGKELTLPYGLDLDADYLW